MEMLRLRHRKPKPGPSLRLPDVLPLQAGTSGERAQDRPAVWHGRPGARLEHGHPRRRRFRLMRLPFSPWVYAVSGTLALACHIILTAKGL